MVGKMALGERSLTGQLMGGGSGWLVSPLSHPLEACLPWEGSSIPRRRLLTLVRTLNCLAQSFFSKGPFFFCHSITVLPWWLRMVRSAPCSMNSARASLSRVVKIGVSPSLLRAFTSAPSCNNSFSTSVRKVSCSGVFRRYRVHSLSLWLERADARTPRAGHLRPIAILSSSEYGSPSLAILHLHPWMMANNLAGQALGIKEVHDDIWLVSFMHYDLGYFGLETRVLEPLENPFGPEVLPIQPVRCITRVSGPDPRRSRPCAIKKRGICCRFLRRGTPSPDHAPERYRLDFCHSSLDARVSGFAVDGEYLHQRRSTDKDRNRRPRSSG
jgi:hypothetical protein